MDLLEGEVMTSSEKNPKTRKKYSKEFKHEALKLAQEIGIPQAASDLGVHDSTLYGWRKSLANEGSDAFRGNGRLKAKYEELRKLRRENEILRQEREILKEAAVFFANLKRPSTT